MDTITNRPFNKHPMPWEIVNLLPLHPYDSVIKETFHHKTLTGITKHCINKINEATCAMCFTSKSPTSP